MVFTAAEAATASALANVGAANRRAHDRVPMRTTVILSMPNGQHVHGRMFDIAKGGVGVVVDNTMHVGLEVRMQFRLPVGPINGTQLVLPAQIMNVVLAASKGGFRMGVRFLHLSAEMNETIESFIMKEAARQHAARNTPATSLRPK
jgi:c-di-GMP-binding flagellar brake protein YcgR